MKALLYPLSLALTLTLSVSASADPTYPAGSGDSVLFLGQPYCQQQDYCPDFAYWENSPPGYVELTEADGTPSDYLWVDFKGELTFESSPLNIPPPAGLPLLGKLVENGAFQEVDRFFPARIPDSRIFHSLAVWNRWFGLARAAIAALSGRPPGCG